MGAADLSDESKSSLAELIERIQSGVVQITTGSGSGSGFIVDADGLVITNEHVVSGERTVGVWLTTGRRYQANVLDRDVASDLALLQINGGGTFDAITVGDPGGVRVGDEVLALGFPLADRIGTDLTVTRGIISSTRTSDGVALLQTDAALNPGNSGGPLVNNAGEVVGVNTSKIEETVDGRPVSNIGFAVSVGEFERRLPALGGRQIAAPSTPAPPPVPTFTPVPTYTPLPTFTPVPTFTSVPTHTPTSTPTPTITPTPTSTPRPTPTSAPTSTPTPTPTFTPTPSPTPIPPFVSVSSGGVYMCGLRADGTVVCRGDNQAGQSSPPKDVRLTSISSGSYHTCGIRAEGVAVCWGLDGDGQSSPPEDQLFTSISSGSNHTCGLRADGIAVCWGDDSNTKSPPSRRRIMNASRLLVVGPDIAAGCVMMVSSSAGGLSLRRHETGVSHL